MRRRDGAGEAGWKKDGGKDTLISQSRDQWHAAWGCFEGAKGFWSVSPAVAEPRPDTRVSL